MNIARPIAIVAIALLVLMLPELGAACPACKETVRGQASGSLSAGFNYTVFGLIGMVFGLFGIVSGVIVRAYRKSAR
jgi:hypothetical protein